MVLVPPKNSEPKPGVPGLREEANLAWGISLRVYGSSLSGLTSHVL